MRKRTGSAASGTNPASGDEVGPSVDAAEAAGLADSPAGPALMASRIEFEARYARWLKARSIVADPTQPDDDDSANCRARELERAERELVFADPPLAWMVWWQFEALEACVADESRDGAYFNKRSVAYLGAIKAHLMSFEFGAV